MEGGCYLKSNQKDFIRGIRIIAMTVIGLYLGFQYILPLIYPFVFSYLIAKSILPIVRWLKKKFQIPYIAGAVGTIILLLGVVGTILYFVGKILLKQLFAFIQDLPVYAQMFVSNLNDVCGCCDKMMGFVKGSVQDAVWNNLKQAWNSVQGNICQLLRLRLFPLLEN